MHPIVYYILLFLAIGGIGMAIANRKVGPAIRKQRWLKYFMYIVFTGIVVLSIFYYFFWFVACAIVLASLAELVKVNYKDGHLQAATLFRALLFFVLVAAGFILFAFTFQYGFQLFIYFQVLVFDGFCQITGQLFGKHKLAPSISPSKTWEGFIGGWIFCCLAALMSHDWPSFTIIQALFFGLITGLAAFCGDMLASWYKRIVKVKDYSNWLPGQGGFLDRFDSFLVTGAVYYLLYITIFKDSFEIVSKIIG